MRAEVIGGAPPEHVAAIAAALAVVESERETAAAAHAGAAGPPDQLSAWVEASRRSAQRAMLQRGPWRLSGRIGRRARS